MTDSHPRHQVLLFSPFFHPEQISTGKYNAFLAQALHRRGCKVAVCSSHPLYPGWKPVRTGDDPDGVEVLRGGSWVRYPASTMGRRAVLEAWFSGHAFLSTLRMASRVSLVLSVFPPNLFALLVSLALPVSVRRIGIVHDLQGVFARSGGSVVRQWVSRLVGLVEKRAFSRCHRLIFLSHDMARQAMEDYALPAEKCTVHYPFVAREQGRGTTSDLEELFASGHRHVVYSGALGEKQDPENLLKLFERVMASRQDVVCHVFSGGPLFEEIKHRYGQKPDCGIRFHDLVPVEQLDELYARSSVQVVPQKQGESQGAFPSKLPNLFASGVPVFALTDSGSETARIVERSGMGCVTPAGDVDSAVARLDRFLDQTAGATHKERSESSKGFIRQNFSLDRLVDELLNEQA